MSDKDLHKIVTGFRKGILGRKSSQWMCRVVCMPLQAYLDVIGVETEMVEGELEIQDELCAVDVDHTWLRLPDGRIIDPTADQFPTPDGGKMPPVYIGELPGWYTVMEEVHA